jgi:hypothetical protein
MTVVFRAQTALRAYHSAMEKVSSLLAIAFASAAYAKPHSWQDGAVMLIEAVTSNNGTAVVPIGGMLARLPIRRTVVH